LRRLAFIFLAGCAPRQAPVETLPPALIDKQVPHEDVAPPPSGGDCMPDFEMPTCGSCVEPGSASVGCGGGGGSGAPHGHRRAALGPGFLFLGMLALRRSRR
jgi:hypothetical protein